MNDRRVSWVDTIPKDNPILEGSWWDTSQPNKLQISLEEYAKQLMNTKEV